MSKRTIVTCDECGSERKESNHWFSLSGSPTMPRLSTFDEADQIPDCSFRLDCCGQRCVMSAIQRWFDKGTALDTPSIPSGRATRKSHAMSHPVEAASADAAGRGWIGLGLDPMRWLGRSFSNLRMATQE